MDKTKEKKENSFQRFIEAAKPFKSGYILSVVTALLGVACRVLPFIFISQIIVALFSGEHSFPVYITYLALMAISYILETVFSGISVNISHSTCYKTLAAIRTSVLEKMFTLPLGYVKGKSIGELKAMVIDRIESLEPTLAHLIPEVTANIIIPIFVIGYMFILDWHIALLSLAILPVGFILTMFVIVGIIAGVLLSGGTQSAEPLSREVLSHTPTIQKYAAEYGIPEYVPVLQAIMMQESGGRGTDPMQASECPYNTRFPNSPNGITENEGGEKFWSWYGFDGRVDW